ncbi:cation:proton antiporter domain-containing protein [Streptomyces sp. NBC_01361]|uniref:cation:proton antiporter domain-containing protein n=1 Tax=Streptomyces sp. NBC_01361 TaxID=2903838 RepID=UPI002E2FCEA2|nr:cation:proton antiporter [Streptomyces sp. NBC_01361]
MEALVAQTVLKAESLVNDGTALVVYGVAVGVTTGSDTLRSGSVAWQFVIAYVDGCGRRPGRGPALAVLRRLDDPTLRIALALLTPFTAYLLAESVDASGVLAVVICGLIVSRVSPRASDAAARLLGFSFFEFAALLLNATLFLLVGLEIPTAVRDLDRSALTQALWLVLVVCVVHRSITTRAYPSRTDSLGLQLFGEGSTVTSLSVWKMGGMAV